MKLSIRFIFSCHFIFTLPECCKHNEKYHDVNTLECDFVKGYIHKSRKYTNAIVGSFILAQIVTCNDTNHNANTYITCNFWTCGMIFLTRTSTLITHAALPNHHTTVMYAVCHVISLAPPVQLLWLWCWHLSLCCSMNYLEFSTLIWINPAYYSLLGLTISQVSFSSILFTSFCKTLTLSGFYFWSATATLCVLRVT